MKKFITKSAGVLTLLSASIAISHADTDVAQLQQQVSQLEQSLKQLKTELSRIQGQSQTVAVSADADSVDAELASEGEDDQSFVTRAELQGLQSDIENYKYQVQRERDTKTALSTRQLLINGVVQAKASYIDEPQVVQPQGQNTGSAVNNRRSSFDLGAVQIGFAGNLFKDYEQGKNLDFNLRFGTSPQTGTNNSYLNLLDAQLIVSWYQGKSNLFDTSGASASFAGKGDVLRKGVDIYYNHHPFGATYEYVQGEDETYSNSTATVYKRESESHTGTLFWNFGEQFVKGFRNQGRYDDWWPKSYQAFYRFDSIDRDTNASNQTIDIHSLGLNAFFAETTKFQVNVNRVNNEITNKTYNELVAQLQYGF